jgi:hypothetical protein
LNNPQEIQSRFESENFPVKGMKYTETSKDGHWTKTMRASVSLKDLVKIKD